MNINGSSLHFRIRNIVRLSILHPNLVKLTGWFSAKQSSNLARGWRSGGSGPWGTLSWASTLQPYHWGGREGGTHLLPFCNSPSSQEQVRMEVDAPQARLSRRVFYFQMRGWRFFFVLLLHQIDLSRAEQIAWTLEVAVWWKSRPAGAQDKVVTRYTHVCRDFYCVNPMEEFTLDGGSENF